MTGNARLALAEYLNQITDRRLARQQQREQTQAAGLSRRLQLLQCPVQLHG